MSASSKSEYGECFLAVQIRLAGSQPVRVQGVTATASPNHQEHLTITIGRALFYLQDRAAFDTLRTAVKEAEGLAQRVFGPEPDAFTEAEEQERLRIAQYGAGRGRKPR